MFLFKVIQSLESHHVPYALVGGLAVALHGATRGTTDVDIVIHLTKKDFLNAEAALQSIGLENRLPVNAEQVFAFREDYIRNRNLIAWSFVDPKKPLDVVDVIITEDLRKMKTKTIPIGPVRVHILALEDLIRMKKTSGRPQDLADVAALKELKKK